MSLRFKIISLVFAMLLITFTAMGIVNYRSITNTERILINGMNREGINLIQATSEALILYLPSQDIDSVIQYANKIVSTKNNLVSFAILDNEFDVIYNHNETDLITLKDKEIFQNKKIYTSFDENTMHFKGPLVDSENGDIFGYIQMGFYKGFINQELKRRTTQLLILFFASLIFLLIILLVVTNKIIIAPVNKMVTTFASVSKGNFSARTNIVTNDEIGFLSKTMNSFLGQLQSVISEVNRIIFGVVEGDYTLRIETELEGDFNEMKEHINQSISLLNKKNLKLQQTQSDLLVSAHKAGMSEIATGVLHNVGNILNSINVSADIILDKIKESPNKNLLNVIPYIKHNLTDLGDYLTNNEKGKLIPQILISLENDIQTNDSELYQELTNLKENIGHIKDIISVQQSLTGATGLIEKISFDSLVEQAMQINDLIGGKHSINVIKDYPCELELKTDKLKVLQIIINLFSNSIDALMGRDHQQIAVKAIEVDNGYIQIEVTDNGIGIDPEEQANVFQYGYTTKESGHGFGLHNSAIAAQELKGELICKSAGIDNGATFILSIPISI